VSKKKSKCQATFEGLEVDLPEGMVPTARTITALYTAQTRGAVMLQFDDSGDPTDAQLQEIAGDCGMVYVRDPNNASVAYLLDEGFAIEID
jgi:hypothetical protein